ncbi:hypothetical protein MRX96_042648 [Rhipicephalus microplus]
MSTPTASSTALSSAPGVSCDHGTEEAVQLTGHVERDGPVIERCLRDITHCTPLTEQDKLACFDHAKKLGAVTSSAAFGTETTRADSRENDDSLRQPYARYTGGRHGLVADRGTSPATREPMRRTCRETRMQAGERTHAPDADKTQCETRRREKRARLMHAGFVGLLPVLAR